MRVPQSIWVMSGLVLASCDGGGDAAAERVSELEARVELLEGKVEVILERDTRRMVREQMEADGLKVRELKVDGYHEAP